MKRLPIICFVLLSMCEFSAEEDTIYLFAHHKYGDRADTLGLHLAYSRDGYNWEVLNNHRSFLKPKVGSTVNDKYFLLHGDSSKIMRDPCIISTKDGTFHMVWTVAWSERGIGYASSKDLITWSEQKYIPVMEKEPSALNCWAPELFFDEQNDQFLIYWATTIPGRFPETKGKTDRFNNRIYYTTTKDFISFKESELFYDHGFDVIDASICKEGNTYVMFVKVSTTDQENICVARSDNLYGPYSPPSDPIAEEYVCEGPTAIEIKDTWIVYFDRYRDEKIGAVASKDLEHWQDISDNLNFPDSISHGTVFKVSERILNKLISI